MRNHSFYGLISRAGRHSSTQVFLVFLLFFFFFPSLFFPFPFFRGIGIYFISLRVARRTNKMSRWHVTGRLQTHRRSVYAERREAEPRRTLCRIKLHVATHIFQASHRAVREGKSALLRGCEWSWARCFAQCHCRYHLSLPDHGRGSPLGRSLLYCPRRRRVEAPANTLNGCCLLLGQAHDHGCAEHAQDQCRTFRLP